MRLNDESGDPVSAMVWDPLHLDFVGQRFGSHLPYIVFEPLLRLVEHHVEVLWGAILVACFELTPVLYREGHTSRSVGHDVTHELVVHRIGCSDHEVVCAVAHSDAFPPDLV